MPKTVMVKRVKRASANRWRDIMLTLSAPAHDRFGVRRPLTKMLPMIRQARMAKPRMRTDQAQPYFGKVARSIKGMMVPPMEFPVIASPVARPLRLSNQWLTAARPAVVIRAEEMPPNTPRQSIKCQYFLHSAKANMAMTYKVLPMIVSTRGPYRSNSGPTQTPRPSAR